MLIHNNGVIGAALVLAGVKVPLEFNLDDGLVVNLARVAESNFPSLSKDAHELLAVVEAARRFAEDLSIRLAEAEKLAEPVIQALDQAAAGGEVAPAPASEHVEPPAPVNEAEFHSEPAHEGDVA